MFELIPWTEKETRPINKMVNKQKEVLYQRRVEIESESGDGIVAVTRESAEESFPRFSANQGWKRSSKQDFTLTWY